MTMTSRSVARDTANIIVVYGVPIIIVILMVVVVNVYSPLMNTAPPILPQPIIQYYRYDILDNNSTIILYFNTKNTEFIGVHNISIRLGSEVVNPLRTVFRNNRLYIVVEPNILKQACRLGKYIDISLTGLVRYLNATAMFQSYGIRLVYSCHITIRIEDKGTFILVFVDGPAWIADEGLEMNISIRLYDRAPTGTVRLVGNSNVTVVYRDLPVIIPVEKHSFGYVFIEYMRGGKIVREGFYIEPEG